MIEDTPTDSAQGSALPPTASSFAEKKWGNGSTIRIAFLNGDTERQRRVSDIAQAWIEDCGLRFDFTAPASDAEVRIEFGMDSWSYLGRDCLNIPRPKATMLLPQFVSSDSLDFKEAVLRQFGHLLGLINEQLQPNADLPWRKSLVYAWFRQNYFWTKSAVDFQVFQKVPPGYYGIDKPFDRDSIMLSAFPGFLFTDGVAVERKSSLSAGDKQFVARLYPSLAPTGQYLESRLTSRGDANRHRLKIMHHGSYSIETSGRTQVNLDVASMSEPGKSLGRHDPIDLVNDRVRLEIEAGTYIVTVKPATAGAAGEYKIRVVAAP